MTEAEWLVCTDPETMLENLRGKARDRKLQLFAVACCRRIWHLLIDDRSKKAVLVAEQAADQRSRSGEIAAAIAESQAAFRACEHLAARHADAAGAAYRLSMWFEGALDIAIRVALTTANAAGYSDYESDFAFQKDVEVEYPHQCSLLREILGNPFQTFWVEPSCLTWNNGTVVKIAEVIYEDRAFERLPILADALEDAGCNDADILAHCRGPGPHVRGCWVVDLLLGKS
jgi:hypothetical protein